MEMLRELGLFSPKRRRLGGTYQQPYGTPEEVIEKTETGFSVMCGRSKRDVSWNTGGFDWI